MNLDWILSPITSYAVIALALVACIACFLSIKREIYRLRRAADVAEQAVQRKIEVIESSVAGMAEHQPTAAELVLRPPTLRRSLNLTRRTQALRMRRRGESIESIAAALATPRNEIELLLKVYEMLEYRRQLKSPQVGQISDLPASVQ